MWDKMPLQDVRVAIGIDIHYSSKTANL